MIYYNLTIDYCMSEPGWAGRVFREIWHRQLGLVHMVHTVLHCGRNVPFELDPPSGCELFDLLRMIIRVETVAGKAGILGLDINRAFMVEFLIAMHPDGKRLGIKPALSAHTHYQMAARLAHFLNTQGGITGHRGQLSASGGSLAPERAEPSRPAASDPRKHGQQLREEQIFGVFRKVASSRMSDDGDR